MKPIIAVLMALSLISTAAFADNATSQGTTMQQPDAGINKTVGDKFLTENKAKPGVTTLPSGLQYKVIKTGKGTSPTASDLVTVNYAGKLIDGTEFDSSYKRHEPATFPVNAVIPGWVEVLKLMKPGDVWEVYIPSPLAYGETGAPPAIGPNQTLIFKIELLNVKKS